MLMKNTFLALAVGLVLAQSAAFADEYDCGPDGYCHQYDVTAEDHGIVDDTFCGPSQLLHENDGKDHVINACGTDEGPSNAE